MSIDEKTQIQALGRTQKGLPMKPGQPATMTHDYKRNDTTTLFAALCQCRSKIPQKCRSKIPHFFGVLAASQFSRRFGSPFWAALVFSAAAAA